MTNGSAAQTPALERHHVIIVGAGFGGLGAGIKLSAKGIDDFVILDRGDEVGGTSRENTYPGVEADIPAVHYSYGHQPNARWSSAFAPGGELFAYAREVADRFELRQKIRFGTEVVSAAYDEDAREWTVEAADGSRFVARFVISCHGALSIPSRPEIPGIDDFEGKMMATQRWDHSYSVAGKRVAVIGTGASALQVIPTIAPETAHLTVYQRTPIWVMPKVNFAIPGALQKVFETVPLSQRIVRSIVSSTTAVAETVAVTHNKRLPYVTKAVAELAKAYLRSQVKDPELREKLTPTYGFGCKRPSMSNTYFSAFERDDVTLETAGIERITPTGIRTVDGNEVELDTIVLATGFKIFGLSYRIAGVGGTDLETQWDAERMASYEGVAVPGFPNFFLAPGPYGVIGFSWFDTIEICVSHAVDMIAKADADGVTRIEADADATAKFVKKMRKRVEHTVLMSPSCNNSNTYYLNKHGDAPYLRPETIVETQFAMRSASKGYVLS
jgi:cation diffusion facilitator CzcD-associated flavoprotein CzcO